MRKTMITRNVKCVAVLTTLQALGCHQPHETHHELVQRDSFQVADFGDSGPFVVAGSSTPIDSSNFVKIFASEA